MQALRILGSLQCVREPPCQQTKPRIFSAQPPALSLNHNPWHSPWLWGSRSFFVSCDLLRQLQFRSHHLPRSATQTFPVRRFSSIAQCLSRPTFASHNSVLGNAQNCSCFIMMTHNDSLSHAACKRTDTVFSYFTKPNFLHLRQVLLISLVFPSLPILILFMPRAAKRGSQPSNGLSSAIHTPVLCSAEF